MMTEKHVGRLVVAALHQALADELPDRLEFYEHWLEAKTLRDGTLRPAPFSAVVGFLRAEGEPYERIVVRAGALAADWTVATLPGVRRRAIGWLPRRWRARAALGVASAASRSGAGTDLTRAVRRDTASVRVDASLFCGGRTKQTMPRCGFYLALLRQTLGHFGVEVDGRIEQCRAMGDPDCRVALALVPRAGGESTARAA